MIHNPHLNRSTFISKVMRSTLRSYLANMPNVDLIGIGLIKPSRFNIRREVGDIDGLKSSIKEKGLLQPILVRMKDDHFEVVAGNRRLEACKRLRWATIPCIVKDMDDKTAFEIALIENVQRKTLNPLEEAEAFRSYVNRYGWGGITDLAHKIGRSVEYVSHRLKLLELPEDVRSKIAANQIAPSIAHELIWLKDEEACRELTQSAVELKLSAKKVRAAIKLTRGGLSVDKALGEYAGLRMNHADKGSTGKKLVEVLEEAILVLRICLVRFDNVVKRAVNPELKSMLLKDRYAIHKIIDNLICEKKRLERKAELPLN